MIFLHRLTFGLETRFTCENLRVFSSTQHPISQYMPLFALEWIIYDKCEQHETAEDNIAIGTIESISFPC